MTSETNLDILVHRSKQKANKMRNAIAMSLALLLGSLARADSQRILNTANGHLYQRYDGGSTWHDAKSFCSLLGGHLATISTSQEDQFIYTNFTGGWLGATDEAAEGDWQWVTGEPWIYGNWAQNEPNNCCPPPYCAGPGCTPEHYLTYWGPPHDGQWNDVPNGRKPFICEWDSPSDVTYQFITLDYPGAPNTRPFGINPQRQVVGWHGGTDGRWHSFLWKDGTFVSFDMPGSRSTEAHSINPQADIVGRYWASDTSITEPKSFLMTRGEFFTIEFPGAVHTVANEITPNRTIVGPYHALDGKVHSYTLKDGAYTSFDFPGATVTDATGINAAGDIVGLQHLTDGRRIGFLIRNVELKSIEYPGASMTWTFDINEGGEIVGFYTLSGRTRGFLLTAGRFISISPPGAGGQTWATRINPGGDVVGHAMGQDGKWHGFLLLRVEQ